jgi:uncharacterized protein (DUF2147 family)
VLDLASKQDQPVAKITKTIALLCCVAGFSSPAKADGITGLWLTEKAGIAVLLDRCEGDTSENPKLCATVKWLKKPYHKSGELKRDAENSNPKLRERPWCGLTVITGLEQTEPGAWTGGKFYFPKDGNSYDFEIKKIADDDQRLKVHAYFGIKLLGKKETWSRVTSELSICPTS